MKTIIKILIIISFIFITLFAYSNGELRKCREESEVENPKKILYQNDNCDIIEYKVKYEINPFALYRQYRLKEDYVLLDASNYTSKLKAGTICEFKRYQISDVWKNGCDYPITKMTSETWREYVECYEQDFTLDQLNLFEPVL